MALQDIKRAGQVDLGVEDLVEEVDLVQSQLKMELLILAVAVAVVDLI